MRRSLTVPLCLLGFASPAFAQFPQNPVPVQPPLNYMPNYFNRVNQPLSPYLNLLRGGIPGVNYYYGVRPGTLAGGMTPMGTPATVGSPFGPQTAFLPQASMVPDPTALFTPEPLPPEGPLPPAGHPIVYGNTFNGHGSFFSVYAPTGVRGAGMQPPPGATPLPRQGMAGLGAAPRPSSRSRPQR
jgi:hypothetical protein